VRKRLLPYVRDFSVDPTGIAASSSRVQSGHVPRPSLLSGANDIVGEFDFPISVYATSFVRTLRFSGTWTAGGTDAVHRNNVLAGGFASRDGCSRPDHLGSYIHDERVYCLR